MQKAEFRAGENWAYRKTTVLEAPAQRVELLVLVPKARPLKVKVRYVGGEFDGLEEFVAAPQLRCRWGEWRKVERDERREAALGSSVAHEPVDPVVVEAANEVLVASGENLYVEGVRGYSRLAGDERAALLRLAERAGAGETAWELAPAFVDRHGTLHLPDDRLVALAARFAAAEPESVTLRLDNEEQSYLREGYRYGERFYHDELLRHKPAWAVARSWGAKDEWRDPLRTELRRVEVLLYRALAALETAGETQAATRLRRAWEGKK